MQILEHPWKYKRISTLDKGRSVDSLCQCVINKSVRTVSHETLATVLSPGRFNCPFTQVTGPCLFMIYLTTLSIAVVWYVVE